MKYRTKYYLFNKECKEYVKIYFSTAYNKDVYCTSHYLDDVGGCTTLRMALRDREKYKKITKRYPQIVKVTTEIIM